MSEQVRREIRCTMTFDGDTKRKHRYLVKSSEGIVGSIYIPRTMDPIPDVIILEKRGDDDNDDN